MKNYILFALLLVVSLSIALFIIFRKRNKYRDNQIIWGAFTLMLTLIGLFLTIGNEYFAQFDYKPKMVVKEMFFHRDNLHFSEIKVNHNVSAPQYYYFMDVSGSMRYAGKRDLTEDIEKKIDFINNSGKGPTDRWNFDVQEGERKIEFRRLLQVRLMHSILKQSEKHKNDFKYSVVKFAGSPSEMINSSKEISEVFQQIYGMPYGGPESDFLSLLEYLNNKIVCNASHADSYEPVEYYLVLLSDNLHDTNHKQSKTDVEQKILSYLWKLHEKKVNLRLFYLDGVNKQNGFPVDHLFKLVFPNSPIGVLDVDDELICPIISKKPISFFYTNSLFEECLTTRFTFDGLNHKKDFSVGLGSFDNNGLENIDGMKQEYYLIEGTDTIHLSRNRQLIRVDLDDHVELMIKGYIHAPYKSPDIIIHDEEEDVRYIIPVTFYKKFPPTGYFLLFCIVLVFAVLLFYLVVKLIEEIGLRHNSDEIIITR